LVQPLIQLEIIIVRNEFRRALISLLAVLVVATLALAATHAFAQSPDAPDKGIAVETAAAREARLAWWRDARFGMFIHFGIYSIPGRGEWVQWNEQIPVAEYAKFAGQFTLTNFNPNAWAETAKAAGMKYMVLTARHHDGFCMFDDTGNNFTTVNSAAHRDVVREYVAAVRQAGLRVGLYYSPLDWRFPGFFFPDLQLANAEAMRDQYHRQMKELLANYGQIDVLWFDGGETDWLSFNHNMNSCGFPERKRDDHYRGRFSWQGEKVNALLRQLQPQIIVNNRAADVPPDFTAREGDGALGNFDDKNPWELCTTLAGAWGYQPNQTPKSLKSCIQLLAKVAGRDGNLLLNVGPAPDGKIDPLQDSRLREIGAWLEKCGQSIYRTRGGPFLPGRYGVSTHRDNIIYLHVLDWPDGKLILPAIPAKVVRASALTGGEATVNQTDRSIEISLPLSGHSDMDTVIALELDRPAAELKPVEVDKL
jgi:alpha-L-fucosidase